MEYSTKKSIQKLQPICIELLNSFTETELDQFTHFVNCYYFNTDKSVVKLFENLRKRILNKKPFEETQQKIVYQQVFDTSSKEFLFNKKEKKHLNAKMSLLKNLAEQFLSVEGLMTNTINYNDLLLKKLLEKKQNRLLERHFKQLDKKTKSVKQKNIEHYELTKTVETYRRDYLYQTGLIYKISKDNFDELTFNFDLFYLIEKLYIFISTLTLKQTSTRKHDLSSFEAINNLLKLPQYQNHSLVSLYKAVVDLLIYENEISYKKLLKSLDTYSSISTKEVLRGFYNVASNYCIQQIRKDKFTYSDLFKIYLEMDQKNLLIVQNTVSILSLNNISSVACRINEFDKATSLIEKYRPYIKKEIRESVCNYNYGIIAFYKKEYNQALQYFIRVDYINLDYDVNCRVIILKCHYEMDKHYDERTMQIFRSANKFFNDNRQLTPQRKKSYRNFIQILIYIYKIKHQETKMQLSRAIEKLEAQEVNSDKNWLQTKMEELGGIK